jgi:hypothetical protein
MNSDDVIDYLIDSRNPVVNILTPMIVAIICIYNIAVDLATAGDDDK